MNRQMNNTDSQKPEATFEQLQCENQALRAKLAETQKLTSLGELVGTTTHEFNNVLMTIINYARMGLRHQDDATRNKAFEKILTASDRACKITNSVLGVARNRENRFETTCLRTVIEQTMVLLERELQKYRINVDYEIADVPPVRAVANQIQQVVMNLLINARQAMPDGGRLIIRLAHDAESQFVDLTIRDFGTGIKQEELPKIFESGFTTKCGPDESGKGGTGLGLYTCRNIIESHKGKIRVESSPGQGTAFTLRIPQILEHQAAPLANMLAAEAVVNTST